MKYKNVYFINGTAYAGKSTMVKMLSEKYHGIACEENYHDVLISNLDSNQYPGLTYTRDLKDWADFVRRTPDEYEAWIEETTKECAVLELQILDKLSKQGKMIFVDTNIPTPDEAIENFRECLMRVNSREKYEHFLNCGFNVIKRDDDRTKEETLLLVEKTFKL